MKKLLILITVLLLSIVGCGSKSDQHIKEISVQDSIDGFENATLNYDKFNSYASENGLDNTPIFITGKVLEESIIEDSDLNTLALIVEQDDGNKWCVQVCSDREITDIDGENVRIFGIYMGFSDLFNLPGISVTHTNAVHLDDARIELQSNGEYVEVWNFYYDYAESELEQLEEMNEQTNEESDIPTSHTQPTNMNAEDYENIFFYTLTDNLDKYNGKKIHTVVKVDNCYSDDVSPYIRSQYSDYELVSNSVDIIIYPYNYQEFPRDEYITVEGTVAKNGSENVIANANIINSGSESQSEFEDGLSVYMQNHNAELQQNKESFIASCVDVSYEDLRRYPDSYEDVPIKLTIHIQDVEPDGWIFPGDIIATLNGQDLAVYDDRQVREPRLIEGDTVTVYATGYGLSKMQVKQKGQLFNKTVDEYDVPAIKIKYTENDKDFVE